MAVSFISQKYDVYKRIKADPDYETDPLTVAIYALHSFMKWNCIVQNILEY